MIFVLTIIFISAICIASLNLLFSALTISALEVFGVTFLCVLALFLIDLIVACVVYFVVPRKAFNPFSKLFMPKKWEKKLYIKLGVKKWKDKVPNKLGMKKDKVYDMDNNVYIKAFLVESCSAETMHFISIFTSFLAILFFDKSYTFTIVLPCCFVNVILQVMPCIIQRYNRPRLMVLYKKNLRNVKTMQAAV